MHMVYIRSFRLRIECTDEFEDEYEERRGVYRATVLAGELHRHWMLRPKLREVSLSLLPRTTPSIVVLLGEPLSRRSGDGGRRVNSGELSTLRMDHDEPRANPTFRKLGPGLDSYANLVTTIPFEHHVVRAGLVMLRVVPSG